MIALQSISANKSPLRGDLTSGRRCAMIAASVGVPLTKMVLSYTGLKVFHLEVVMLRLVIWKIWDYVLLATMDVADKLSLYKLHYIAWRAFLNNNKPVTE